MPPLLQMEESARQTIDHLLTAAGRQVCVTQDAHITAHRGVAMRAVKTRAFCEQMNGRGVRVINPDDLQSVTPVTEAKDRCVIADAFLRAA